MYTRGINGWHVQTRWTSTRSIECVVIDQDTRLGEFTSQVYYHLANGV
jgi:hypothetical protein